MRGLNKVMLIGNLGKDPEFKFVDGNIALAKFSIATTEMHKDKEGNQVSQTEWHNIIAWRGLAELAEKYLKKGHKVYIEGRLKTRSWEDANQTKKYITEILADNMILLEKRDSNDVSDLAIDEGPVDEPDLPF